jgi:hypothetical protein
MTKKIDKAWYLASASQDRARIVFDCRTAKYRDSRRRLFRWSSRAPQNGIGAPIAKHLAAEGAAVVVNDRIQIRQ